MNRTTIEIKEEFRLPGTDIILEKGDRVRVKEASQRAVDRFYDEVVNGIYGGDIEKALMEILKQLSDSELNRITDSLLLFV